MFFCFDLKNLDPETEHVFPGNLPRGIFAGFVVQGAFSAMPRVPFDIPQIGMKVMITLAMLGWPTSTLGHIQVSFTGELMLESTSEVKKIAHCNLQPSKLCLHSVWCLSVAQTLD